MVIILITAYTSYVVLSFVAATITWKLKNIRNKKQAVEIFAEARRQLTSFDEVAQHKCDVIKYADVTQLREGLLKGSWTSIDLVNYFGNRC